MSTGAAALPVRNANEPPLGFTRELLNEECILVHRVTAGFARVFACDVKRLKDRGVTVLAVSVDGVPESHNRIRGNTRAFAWTERGLGYLQQAGVGFATIFTLTDTPAQVSPPYFESGFPFGHDQFISAAATSNADFLTVSRLAISSCCFSYVRRCTSNRSAFSRLYCVKFPGYDSTVP
jgi:hypothetical protein